MNAHEPKTGDLDWKLINQDEHQEVTIETLKTPPINIQPAPSARRFGACLIDSLLIGIIWLVISHISGQSSFLGLSFRSGLVLYVISFLYYSAAEGLFSATPGKRITKIHVVGPDGDPCTIKEATLRNLLRVIDWLPFFYILGLGVLSITSKKQRVGDKAAHTIVTMAPERDRTPPPAPFLFH